MSDTIYALASGAGRAGVAVLRVSGPQSWDSLQALSAGAYEARLGVLRTLKVPSSAEVLDQALVLPFKGPASYTGEDVVEYHLHGGRAVIDSVLAALSQMDGHRMAEPGEFTRRAFENGKMDLTEAEAVADLIDAQTQAQKDQALSQMGGDLARLYEGWAERLKRALAHLEADIEFPDEDMPEGVAPEVVGALEGLMGEMDAHLNDNRRGERLRDGIKIAVIGAPNAGKSSLVNALAHRDAAIVSDMAGTTRDVIEVHLDLAGYPVILADTAGLRPDQIGGEGQDGIEQEGIKRALARAEEADITLLLFDGAAEMIDPHTLALIDERAIMAVSKVDISGTPLDLEGALGISVESGEGVQELLSALEARIEDLMDSSRDMPSLTRARHRENVVGALEALQRSQGSKGAALPELMAEDVRLAVRSLGKITGRVDVEDLLDVIFKDFCIGK